MNRVWVVGVAAAVAVFAVPGSGQQPEQRGLTHTYRNVNMFFELKGETGTFSYLCTCGRWHSYPLVHEKKTVYENEKAGDRFNGHVYKVRGRDWWYFLSDEPVDSVDGQGNPVKRYPIAASNVSSSKGFNRVYREDGTSRRTRTSLQEVVRDAEVTSGEAGSSLPEGETQPPPAPATGPIKI